VASACGGWQALDVTERLESISTWRQPMPDRTSRQRRRLLDDLASEIADLSAGWVRVAIDGRTAAGKTSFGHELAAALRDLRRPSLRASLDDFKYPWEDSDRRGYDRTSGEGYLRNPWDFESVRQLLLEPLGPGGSGRVVLCAHDPLTGVDHRDVVAEAPPRAVLVVDGVFAFRPEFDGFWDYRIWLEVDPDLSLARGVDRDIEREGADEALALHRDRYAVAEAAYVATVAPLARADVVIDNTDFDSPHRLHLAPGD
jgi:uridine kinase